MQTVWKYTITVVDEPINIAVPHGAEFLAAQPATSGRIGGIDMWFRVDTDEKREDHRVFITRGTGHPLPPVADTYRATCVTAGGALVWHLFEVA